MGLFDKAKESIVKAKESAQEAYDQAKELAQESTQETFDKAKDSEVVKLIIPIIEDKIDIIKTMDVETFNNDEKFHEQFSDRIYSLLTLYSGGIIKVIPFFKKKFYASMIEVKNEIVDINGEEVSIRPDFQEKLPQAIMRGLRK
jgi:hypothetical protein